MNHALLIPRRRSGFSPLNFGSDLALWIDPSYGVYTDRSTQLTAASSQYWSVAHNSSLRFTTAMSLSFWVYRDTDAADQCFLGKWTYQTDGGWVIQSISDGVGSTAIRVFIATSAADDGSGCSIGFADAAVTHGAWHHVCLIFDGSLSGDANRLKLYVDGTQKTLSVVGGAVPAALVADTADLNIGKFGGSLTRYHNGRMDSVRIWGRALSAADVASEYNAGAGKVYADLTAAEVVSLAAAYDFDGDGLDAHGSNDLTAVNSPTYTSGIASGTAGDGDVVSLVDARTGPNSGPPSYAGRPLWVANAGKPYFSFDGANDGLQTASNISLGAFTIAGNFYASGTAGILCEHGPGFGVGDGSTFYDAIFSATRSPEASSKTRTAGTLSDSNWRTLVEVFGGTHASHLLRVNGAEAATTDVFTGDPGSATVADKIYLGMRLGGTFPATMRLGDFVAVNRVLTASELAQLESWLASRRAA